MEIQIHSVSSIERLAEKPFKPNTVLLSIDDTGEQMPKLAHKPLDILRLEFDDITIEQAWDEYGFPLELRDNDRLIKSFLKSKGVNVFSVIQAEKIADFVFKHKDSCDIFICQCHYGQSRSAGCAAAISEFLYKNGITIFADENYYPNKLVFKLVLNALKRKAKALAKND